MASGGAGAEARDHAARRGPPIAMLLAALALALYGGSSALLGFDGLYGQDPYGYYTYAGEVARSIRALRLPPPYYWPLGYPLLAAAGFALIGVTPLAAQAASMLAGVGVVVLVYALACELARQAGCGAAERTVGSVAGLVALACGQLWQWSVTIMADAPALGWATLAAWALVRYSATVRLRWLVLAATGLALALITRWVYGLMALPLAAYWLLAVWWTGEPAQRPALLRHFLLAGLLGLALLTSQLLVSASRPQVVLAHQWLVGWSPLNALGRSFETVDGRADYPLPVALFYARAAVSPRFLAPPLAPLLALGLVTVVRRRRWRVAVLLLGWAATMYAFLCGIPYQNFRFTLALLPPLAILSAIGYAVAARRLASPWRVALRVWLLLGLAVGLVYSAGVLHEQVHRKRADLSVARRVEAQAGPGGQVLAFELTLTLRHYTALDVHELFDLTPSELTSLAREACPLYLLVDVADLEGQWRGRPPELNYRRLRDGPGLVEIDRLAGYTLFRVGPVVEHLCASH